MNGRKIRDLPDKRQRLGGELPGLLGELPEEKGDISIKLCLSAEEISGRRNARLLISRFPQAKESQRPSHVQRDGVLIARYDRGVGNARPGRRRRKIIGPFEQKTTRVVGRP